jgi:hypothetical protein
MLFFKGPSGRKRDLEEMWFRPDSWLKPLHLRGEADRSTGVRKMDQSNP